MKHTTILYFVIAGLIIALFFSLKGCRKQPTDGLPPGSNDSLQKWVNSMGDTVSALKSTREKLSRKNLDFDSLAKLYRTKPKFIKEVTTITIEGKERIVPSGPPVVIYDTIDGGGIHWFNQAFENNYHVAMIKINHRDRDSSFMELSSVDTIDIVGKVVNEGNIFNRSTYYQIDAKNRNPYTTITSVNAFRAPLPTQHFELNAKGGYSTKGQPAAFAGGEAVIFLNRRLSVSVEGGVQFTDGVRKYGEGSAKYNIFKF